MKKIKITLISLILLLSSVVSISALDVPFEGHEEEWKNFCLQTDLTDEQENQCKEYMSYISQQSNDLEDQINDINKELESVQHNIEEQIITINKYKKEIDGFKVKIEELRVSINEKINDIAKKEQEIEEMEEEIARLNEKVRGRMVQIQKTIRFNDAFDFLMGADNFEDLIARANGLAIMEKYDDQLRESLKGLLNDLNIVKKELEDDKKELEEDKAKEERAKAAVDALLKKAEEVKVEYLKLKSELEAKGNQIAGDLEELRNSLKQISSAISNVVTSNGFVRPVNGGYISAGTWAYPTGGVHLGMDFANDTGTPLYAIGNGVIIYSTDGCGYGHLGNSCGGSPLGSAGGGNQLYLIVSVNGSVYGVRYLHLLKGTPKSAGTIVYAGEQVGQMGSSGNSSGPHLHLEIIYLGTGILIDYVDKWMENGDLTFGTGFGKKGLERLCENGVSAPCRERPEKFFG